MEDAQRPAPVEPDTKDQREKDADEFENYLDHGVEMSRELTSSESRHVYSELK